MDFRERASHEYRKQQEKAQKEQLPQREQERKRLERITNSLVVWIKDVIGEKVIIQRLVEKLPTKHPYGDVYGVVLLDGIQLGICYFFRGGNSNLSEEQESALAVLKYDQTTGLWEYQKFGTLADLGKILDDRQNPSYPNSGYVVPPTGFIGGVGPGGRHPRGRRPGGR